MGRKTRRQKGGGGAGGNNGEGLYRLARKRRGSEDNIVPYGGSTPSGPSLLNTAKSFGGSLLRVLQQTSAPAADSIQQGEPEPEPTIEEDLERLNAKLKGKNPNEYLFILTKEEYENINKVRENNKTLFERLYIRGVTDYEIRIINFLRTKRLTLEQLERCYSST